MNQLKEKISNLVDSSQDEIFDFIQKLVNTPSLPGKEQKAQELIAAKLNQLNLKVDKVQSVYEELRNHPAFYNDGFAAEERINIVGCWRAAENIRHPIGKKGHSLILNGHIDVVTPGQEDLWEDSPWSGKIKDGKLFGRGSVDMKSGLASGIFAIQVLQKLGFKPRNNILIESVVGEESGGIGTLTTLIKGYTADAAIIMEPTQLNLCPVQSGALTFRIKVSGKSVHACMKNKGISAIEKFYYILKVINELEKNRHLSYHNSIYEDHMNVAPVSIGTVKGGNWHSTVPDKLIAEGRFGVFPGESLEAAKKSLEEALKKTAEQDPWLKENPPVMELFEGQFEPGVTDLREPFLQVLINNHKNVTAKEIKIQGVTYGSDLRLFTNYGKIPAVLYGPGNVIDAHTVNEFISLEEVQTCIKVLAGTIYHWCGGEVKL